jgi:hypothetical protein
MWKTIALAAALAVAGSAQAQSKKELVQKVLQLQQAGIESMARSMAERPALVLLQQAGQVVQARVAADKREAVAKDLQTEAKKYADEAVPLARERVGKLAPSTLGTLLEEKFSEDELKQVVAWMESPVVRKFQQLMPEMEQSLAQKLSADLGPALEPKLKKLEQFMRKRLESAGVTLPPPAAAAAASDTSPKK